MATTETNDLRLRITCQLRDAESTSEDYAADLSRAMRYEISTEETARAFFESTYKTDAMGLVCDYVFDRLANEGQARSPRSIDLAADSAEARPTRSSRSRPRHCIPNSSVKASRLFYPNLCPPVPSA